MATLDQDDLNAIAALIPTAVQNAAAVWDRVLSGATHNIATSAGRRLRGLQDFTSYDGGAVWLDTLNGTAGTTLFESGTPDNPVDNLADATTIANAVSLKHFHIANGSSITLAAAYDNFEFEGDEFTIATGGQSIDNSSISNALLVSGTYLGYPHIVKSIIGNLTGPGVKIGMSAIRGAVVLDANTNIMVMHDCWTSNAALAAMDFGSGVGANVVYIQNYNGPIEIRNMATGDTLWFSGTGKLTLAASCTGGTVNIAGNVELVNSGTGLTVNDSGRMAEDQSLTAAGGDATLANQTAILAAIGTAAIVHSPVVRPGYVQVVEGATYDGRFAPRIFWTVSADYTTVDAIELTIWRCEDDGTRTIMKTIAGTATTATNVQIDDFVATFDAALVFAGKPMQETLQFAIIAIDGADEYVIASGDFVVIERRR